MAKKKDASIETSSNEPVLDGETTIQSEEVPKYGDSGWSDYIMKQFDHDELFESSPTADGLRRVCNKFFGRIIDSNIELISYPTPQNPTAYVKCTLTIQTKCGDIRVSEIADANANNVSDPTYSRFLTAVCSTRAEARALRKALGLKKVVAVEEMSEVQQMPEFIVTSQLIAMNSVGRKANINVEALINSGSTKYDDIKRIPYVKALEMLKYMNELQQDTTKIKPELKGYKEGWETKGS